MPVPGWTKMSEEQRELARDWYSRGKKPSEIAELLGRDTSTMARLLCMQKQPKKQGRPKALTTAQVDLLERRLDELIVKVDGATTITVETLKKATKSKASTQCILHALHKRNIYFRKLREKPVLTPADIRDRYAFAKKYRGKSKQWWLSNVHAFIDGKHFQVYLTGAERVRAAKHVTFGAYRRPGQGLCKGYVKPKEGNLRHNTGAKGVLLHVGVGAGKVISVQEVAGRWNGNPASVFYKTLAKDLAKAWPGKRKYTVLEDNDPTGYKSSKGLAAKHEAQIGVLEIPKRSPDLSVLDYAIWKEVNKRLRKQEKTWSGAKRETRPQYLKRLKRTIRNLPKAFLEDSIGDMVRRCKRLYESKGYFFEEARLADPVTFAAVLSETALEAETPLKDLADLSRLQVRDALLDAVAHPVPEATPRGGRPRSKVLEVVKLVVFLEEPKHFHAALKLNTSTRFMPLKLALRQRSGLASHWSTTHKQWWSALRYGVFTTERKPVVDFQPVAWLKSLGSLEAIQVGDRPCQEFVVPGRDAVVLNLYEESQEPWSATMWTKRRQQAEAAAAGAEASGGKKARVPKFNLLDFTALALEKKLLTPSAVLAYVQEYGSHACQLFCVRNQKRLSELIAGAEQWQGAKQQHALEQESDWAVVQRLAQTSCSCQGSCEWSEAACDFFSRNHATIDQELLAASLANVICHGPSKTARVPMLAGTTNAGKSMILDPLVNVFGRNAVDFCPALGASMALSSLATNKAIRFIYWDEFSPTEFASRPARSPTVPAVTFKKLFAGQILRIQVSQSHHDGNPDFKWTRGAALTAPLEGLWDATSPVSREDVRHMQSRVIQFDAHVAINGALKKVPHCWTKMSEEQRELARDWYSRGKKPSEIAELLGRDTSTMTRLLCMQKQPKKQGRPKALTTAQVDLLERRLDELIVKVDGATTITVETLKKATKSKASTQCILHALHKRNIYFRKLREKPVLTPADIRDRYAFAKKYRGKSKQWWLSNVHAFIDGKHFQVYLTGAERVRAAKHVTFGAYRRPGQGLCKGYVKPKEGNLRHNTGAKGVLLHVGVGAGKVISVQEVAGRWNGNSASVFYKTLAKDLAKAWPGKRKYTVLEDNDPTGYKSSKGLAAKHEAQIGVLEIPKRSPDLSVLDYAIWKEVNKRLRKQEKTWSGAKRETRPQYLKRLKRTIRNLPKAFLEDSIGDMVRRCKRLYESKGYFFEEARLADPVTFAAVLSETALEAETPLKDLADLSRLQVRDALLDAVAHPVPEATPRGGRPRSKVLEVVKLVVFLEEPKHFHAALKLNTSTRFMPLKLALRQRSGLASHWSTTHKQWWSALRYGVFTTERKPVVDFQPVAWLKSLGSLEAIQVGDRPPPEPWSATMWTKRRQQAEAAADGAEASGGKKARVPKFNLLDFTALALEKKLLTPSAVLADVQEYGSHACQLFCVRNQKRLSELIAGAEQWQGAKQQHALEQESDWAVVQRLAQTSCSCQGSCEWSEAACDFFSRNHATIDKELLAASLANVILTHGPRKKAAGPQLAGTNQCREEYDSWSHCQSSSAENAVDFCPSPRRASDGPEFAGDQKTSYSLILLRDEFLTPLLPSCVCSK
ncbi:F52C9.6 [Symbiodinium sp. CCMP2592]|nr:F52C9.6 [Symbiodinium sp. CCMP2592]